MGLRLKFNLVLLAALAAGLLLAHFLSRSLLLDIAQKQVEQEARIIMQAARASRIYTSGNLRPAVKPHLDKNDFIPQTVPSYAATTQMQILHESIPEYFYKEAALNPTSKSHQADAWETKLIGYFRNKKTTDELVGVRNSEEGQVLYLARPMQIKKEQCLDCHGKPADAPANMLKIYGDKNGFDWKLNEIVGAQLVTVNMQVTLDRANHAHARIMQGLLLVSVLIAVVLNVLLHFVVIKPTRAMAENANKISMGDLEIEEFEVPGNDEISQLGQSFNRMYRSLSSAMKLLDEKDRA